MRRCKRGGIGALRIRRRTPEEQILHNERLLAVIHLSIMAMMEEKPPHLHWKKRKLQEWRLEEKMAAELAGGEGEAKVGYSEELVVLATVAVEKGMETEMTGEIGVEMGIQTDNGQGGDQKGEDVSKKDAGTQVTRTCLPERIMRQKELKRRLVNSGRLMEGKGEGKIEVIDLTKDDEPPAQTVEQASAPPQEMEVEQEVGKKEEEQDPPPVLLPITAMAFNDLAEKDVVHPPKLVSMEPNNGSPRKRRKISADVQSTSRIETRSQTLHNRKDLSKLNKAYVETMPGLNYETPCLTAISSFLDAFGQKRWICLACREYEEVVSTSPMICCENCDDWYHIRCVHLERPFAEDQPWFCRRCIIKAGLQI